MQTDEFSTDGKSHRVQRRATTERGEFRELIGTSQLGHGG